MMYDVKITTKENVYITLKNIDCLIEEYFEGVVRFGVSTRNGAGRWVHIPYHEISRIDIKEVQE